MFWLPLITRAFCILSSISFLSFFGIKLSTRRGLFISSPSMYFPFRSDIAFSTLSWLTKHTYPNSLLMGNSLKTFPTFVTRIYFGIFTVFISPYWEKRLCNFSSLKEGGRFLTWRLQFLYWLFILILLSAILAWSIFCLIFFFCKYSL